MPFELPIVEDLTEEQEKRRRFLISELYLGYRTFTNARSTANTSNYGQRLYNEQLEHSTLEQLEFEYRTVSWIKRTDRK